MFVHKYTWTEKHGGGNKIIVTVRMVKINNVGPNVEVEVTRSSDFIGEYAAGKKELHKVKESGKSGDAYRNVNLALIHDAFQHHHVEMRTNGTLTIKLDTHEGFQARSCCAVQ